MSYTYKYPRPALTVDVVLFKKVNGEWKILLVQRKHPPYKHMWALPGGFVNMDETLEDAAVRELKEETNIDANNLNQLKAYSTLNRDPRFRTVSMVFIGLLDDMQQPLAGDDARKADWFLMNKLPPLAFDHNTIVKDAFEAIKNMKSEAEF